MKSYSHLFQKEIHRLEKKTEGEPETNPEVFMLNFLKEASNTSIVDLSDDIYKCLRAWPCMKTILILVIWLLLRNDERRNEQ